MSDLFKRVHYKHTPRNVNLVIEAERAAATFNNKVAVGLTAIFQAMPTFWLILAWIVLWIIANATITHFDRMPWPLLLCLASVPQLPLMIVIMVGQGLLGHKQELQAQEAYDFTVKSYHDVEQILLHLTAQDSELLKQTALLMQLLQAQNAST